MKLLRVLPDDILMLYKLLEERTPEQSISHKSMPTLKDHDWFVRSNPYHRWYVIVVSAEKVGATYLTHKKEVGIGIFKAHHRRGYAEQALRMLMEMHPCVMQAHINPRNEPSIRLFGKLGFRHIQQTYEYEPVHSL